MASDKSGLQRRETFIDAASIQKEYEEAGVKKTYTDAEYKAMLDARAKQDLATLVKTETFNGNLNVTGGVWRLNEHYFLGDIVTIKESKINQLASVRIIEITEAQDENGYSVEIKYTNS